MKYIFCVCLCLCIPFFSFSEEVNVEEKQSESVKNRKGPIPDPLNLSNKWWAYFNVPVSQLPEKISKFKEKIQGLKENLSSEEHRAIKQSIDRIFFNFDVLLQKKASSFSDSSTNLQFLKSYTVDQMLKVNTSYQNTSIKLSNEKEVLDVEKGNLNRVKTKLDELLLQYPNASDASFKKLELGLAIISKRIEQAISETNLSNSRIKIEYLELEKKRLEQELSYAQNNLNFNEETEANLQQELLYSERKVEIERNNLHNLQKRAFYEERKNLDNQLNCCLWENKILTQLVITETYKIKNLISQIKYELFLFANHSKDYSGSHLKKMIALFQEQISESKMNIKQWEQNIKDEQARIGKQVEGTLGKEKSDPLINDSVIIEIHLEMDQIFFRLQELKVLIQNAELLTKQLEWNLIKDKSLQETWWLLLQKKIENGYEFFVNFTGYALFHVQNKPVTILNLLQATLIFIAAMFISKVLKKAMLDKRYLSRRLSSSTQYIIARCFHYVFMIIGIFLSLSFIGLDFTNFMIFAGALGVGIGFGMQSMVNNIFSGLLLLLQRNIKVGDIVELTDRLRGRVQEITLQNTHIHSFEGLDLIVPNSQLTSHVLNNWTLHDSCRRYNIPFHVAMDTDKERVKEIVIEVANKVPSVKKNDPRYSNPQLWLMGFDDFGMKFELVVWVDLDISLPTGIAKATLLWNIDTALKENGISVAYPQRYVSFIKEKE